MKEKEITLDESGGRERTAQPQLPGPGVVTGNLPRCGWRSPATRGTHPPEAIPAVGSSGTSAACPSGRRAGRRRRPLRSHRRPGSTTPLAVTATRRPSLGTEARRERRSARSPRWPSRCCRPAGASGSIRPISSTSHMNQESRSKVQSG